MYTRQPKVRRRDRSSFDDQNRVRTESSPDHQSCVELEE
jgi:hypothetical protein